MDTAHTPYTFGMATGEIIILLLLTFLLGMLLCWLLRKMGLCCRTHKKATIHNVRNFDLNMNLSQPSPKLAVPDVYVPKVKVQPRLVDVPAVDTTVDLPDITLPKPVIDTPDIELYKPEIDVIDIELVDNDLHLPDVELPKAELYVPDIELHTSKPEWLAAIDPHKPIIDPPDVDLGLDVNLDTELEVPTMHIEPPTLDPLLVAIDPHKPIIDPPDMDIELDLETPPLSMESVQVEIAPLNIAPSASIELPTIDPLLAAVDPHKPIIDPPDMDIDMELDKKLDTELNPELEMPTMQIDPHKPIIDPPDMEPSPSPTTSGGSMFNDWIHKAKESVEHLAEKATPAANEWIHKAKDSVEHLTDKATPATNDWLNKAKDSVGHLTEKVTPAANEWIHKAKDSVEHLTEKATPTTSEWLNKAKEIGSGISAKSNSLGSSETLAKGSSTLAALAASAKELTEKLASNLSGKHDDLQKLTGIGPTFASVLHRAGIHTYAQLAETSPQKLQALLIVEDEQFSQHDTSSWPKQAALAAHEEWDQLKAYQDSL